MWVCNQFQILRKCTLLSGLRNVSRSFEDMCMLQFPAWVKGQRSKDLIVQNYVWMYIDVCIPESGTYMAYCVQYMGLGPSFGSC